MSCPFYGRAIVSVQQPAFPALADISGASVAVRPFTLFLSTGGNQCGLITGAHSPCRMETELQRPPDWSLCPRNPDVAEARLRAEGKASIWI